MKLYKPLKANIWHGRIDEPNDVDSLRWHQVVKQIDLPRYEVSENRNYRKTICFIGFKSDAGVKENLGRVGAAKAPDAIRKEMSNLPLLNNEILLLDAGDIVCKNDLQQAQKELGQAVEKILSLGMFPVVIGGGHETTLGNYLGVSNFLKNKEVNYDLGIINFDAHFDLRPYNGKPSSGNMFSQIVDICKNEKQKFHYYVIGLQKTGNTRSLFNKADNLNVRYELAKNITANSLMEIYERIDKFVSENNKMYATLCADVISSAYAPGVSSPQPFGMNPELILNLLKYVIKSGKVCSFDVAEVVPRYDNDRNTAKLIAIIIYAIINELVVEVIQD